MSKFSLAMTDTLIASELFIRIERRRKQMGFTQVSLSERVGITPKTYRNLKEGSCSVMILLMVLRELALLENLDVLVPNPSLRPSEVLKQEAPPRRAKHEVFKKTNVASVLCSRKSLK